MTLIACKPASARQEPQKPKDNYSRYCASCHGLKGDGNGYEAGSLKTKPTDFTDPEYANVSDKIIFWTIKKGGGFTGLSSEMPAWEQVLSDEEIRAMIDKIRSFQER